jgi:2-polyprenyl-3-methyl-5-hydroxy-6-metoxy-1,4-benzoquinol methylase
MPQVEDENLSAKRAWNRNAEFWNQRMADGNDFFHALLWPAVETLLHPECGDCLLDVACGNGLTSRKLAHSGARVTGFDFSEAMIELARKQSPALNIDSRVLDATERQTLLSLGQGSFDGALCNMALMDMADINPLMHALACLLKPNGRFVFSVMHPCFNNPSSIHVGEVEDRAGTLVSTYSVKISRYLTPFTQPGLAMLDQPVPHLYFHRPLAALLRPAFNVGFVLDAMEERSFPAENLGGSTSLSWNGHFSEIPPALIVRLRI